MIGGFSLISESKRRLGNVPEDSFRHLKKGGKGYLAVADGVSRDPFNSYPDLSSKRGKKLMARHYPMSSVAKIAANIAVGSEDLYIANRKIARLNKTRVPDPNWLKEDLAGCTASLAKINGNELTYQFIGCCGIGVVSKDGKIRLQTPDEYWATDRKRWDLVNKAEFVKGFLLSVGKNHQWWQHPEGRFLMRRFFRNKPEQKYSFGVLTGEREAEAYIRQGRFRLKEGDIVFVYSDGLRNSLFSESGLKLLAGRNFSRLEEFCRRRVNSEGTVAYWVKE